VLVATDLASKGIDFKNIKHVINFDMPKDVCYYFKFEQNMFKNLVFCDIFTKINLY